MCLNKYKLYYSICLKKKEQASVKNINNSIIYTIVTHKLTMYYFIFITINK